MNQKFAVLRKKNVSKPKNNNRYTYKHRSTSSNVVCISCGYNSKACSSACCPICKEPLYNHHTSTKIPKFKSKNWNKFVEFILFGRLRDIMWYENTNRLVYKYNNPLKDKDKIYLVDDELKLLSKYDSSFCMKNNICPDLTFNRRDTRYIINRIKKSNEIFY